MKFYIKKIWLLAALQHSRSIRLALLAALQQQQLEMIGYWLLATLQQLVKIRKRLLTNVLSAVKFLLVETSCGHPSEMQVHEISA